MITLFTIYFNYLLYTSYSPEQWSTPIRRGSVYREYCRADKDIIKAHRFIWLLVGHDTNQTALMETRTNKLTRATSGDSKRKSTVVGKIKKLQIMLTD